MLFDKPNFQKAYKQILRNARDSGGCTVLICVASDCDALCACRILRALLKGDNIQYKIMPVCGLGDLRHLNEQFIKDSDELRSIIMLNCGGVVNLHEILSLPRRISCFVLDSHRPVHLANIYTEGKSVVVFNDGTLQLRDLPSDGSDIDLDPNSQSEDESDMSDDENFDENSRKRRKTENGSKDVLGPRKMKRARREKLSEYVCIYSFHFCMPAASLAYILAQQMNNVNNDLLWYAVVGVTHQYLNQNMTRNAYIELVTDYQQEVNTKNALSATELTVEDGTVVKAAEHGRIVFEENEYKFMLHRHWSLYDSMYVFIMNF
eukprot:GSMAST32.ASY1.ANO1.1394.1 assembled CDS